MKVALIDCEDSYTYNIFEIVRKNTVFIEMISSNLVTMEELECYDKLILGPGPKSPIHTPILSEIIEKFQSRKPILGVCLGHQAIGMYYGHKLTKSKFPRHGLTDDIQISTDVLYQGMNSSTLKGMRYNSLTLEDMDESPLSVIGRSHLGEIMVIKHKQFPIYGIQFHPESIGSPKGELLIKNFLFRIF